MRILFSICSLLFLTAFTALADSDVIKLVSSFPRTGSSNAQTSSLVNGIRLAIEEAGNKVGNFKIELLDWDDASPERGNWDPALEAQNADKAVKDPDVMAYIGPYNSGAAKISMPKLNQAGLVQISPAATWPGLTKPGTGEPNEPRIYQPTGKPSFFRVVPADDIQGQVAAKWSVELGAKRVFLTHDGELYGKGIASVYKKTAPTVGLNIVGIEQIDPKASNYRSLATKIRQTNPDLVFFGGLTQTNAGQFVKDLRSSGYLGKVMVPDGCFETAFIESAGATNLEGNTFITFGGLPGSQLTGRGKTFYENYKKRFNAEPEAYAVYGYEAGKVALTAITRAGKKDRAEILKAVSETANVGGALGDWSFDKNGDTSLVVMSGNTVKGGKFEFVKILG